MEIYKFLKESTLGYCIIAKLNTENWIQISEAGNRHYIQDRQEGSTNWMIYIKANDYQLTKPKQRMVNFIKNVYNIFLNTWVDSWLLTIQEKSLPNWAQLSTTVK